MADLDAETRQALAETIADEMHRACEFLNDRRRERERTYHFAEAHLARAREFADRLAPVIAAYGDRRAAQEREAVTRFYEGDDDDEWENFCIPHCVDDLCRNGNGCAYPAARAGVQGDQA